MTQEQIQQNNELIADFMGWIHHEDVGYDRWEMTNSLKYHSSWDALMPVVEKIEGLGHKTIIGGGDSWGDYMNIMYGKSKEETAERLLSANMETKAMGMGSSKIVAVYAAVVNFIKWYNEQPK